MDIQEKPIVVIIPSYNNIKWYEKNLNSVLNQNYTNYRIIYIDDHSIDGTAQAVQTYLKEKKNVELILNQQRVGAMANLYHAIYSCQDNEIIVTVDGDDWLYHLDVLKNINQIYSSHEIWLTHGSFIKYPTFSFGWSCPVPESNIKNNTFRQLEYFPTHLRTFYAGLFKKIKIEDLQFEGQFLEMTWDLAMMFPMLEMAGERHYFISDINYVYNMDNPLNDHKINVERQWFLDRYLRTKPCYRRLTDLKLG